MFRVSALGVAALALSLGTPTVSPSYLDRLEEMRGTSYADANCSGYICQAKRHAPCSAQQFWNGCGGDLTVVQQVESLSKLDRNSLHAGDVLDFHGVHVAVYMGGGEIMDSVPERGVGTVSQPKSNDIWYAGNVRVLRWIQ
jgi:hypothetical protein